MPKVPKSKVGQKTVHPNSRRAGQMSKESHRNQRIEKVHKDKVQKVETLGEKLKWFQDNLEGSEDKTMFTKKEACDLIEKYLERFDEELDQIEIVHSLKGRSQFQHISRKQAIEMTLGREKQDYEDGRFEIPDLINGKNLKTFREWNGELRLIQNIKMKKFGKADKEEKPKESDGQEKSMEVNEKKKDSDKNMDSIDDMDDTK